MDQYLHTIIAVVFLGGAYYLGRFLGGRTWYIEGKYQGAEDLLAILDAEGTYSRTNLTASVERWVVSRENEHD